MYRRRGAFYTADLLTACIPQAQTLAERLPAVLADVASLDRLGATLAEFHLVGACHADLNAHNVLCDPAGRWWLIDFDRGRMRAVDSRWWSQRLARLHRSLRKLGAEACADWPRAWQSIIAAHTRAIER
jgi:3-deoxy-D-manno-octulosonic acid kinase